MKQFEIKPANRISNIGEYYFSKKLTEVRNLKQKGKPIVNLGIGNPDMRPDNSVIESLISSSKSSESHFYQSYKGLAELRKSYADWYKKFYKVNLNPETEVLPLAGSKEGIMLISNALINPGDNVLIPDPGYPVYSSISKMFGANIIYYKLTEENNWLPDFNNLKNIVTDNKIKLMWINYPNMPTGAKSDENLFRKIADFSAEFGIIVCNDNPYSMILNNNPQSLLKFSTKENLLIELNSLSKSYNIQGFRQGVAVSNSKVIDFLLRVKSNFDSGMYKPLQYAAIAAMKLNGDWYKKINQTYRIRKEKILRMMDIINCEYKKETVGMFVWAKVSNQYKSGEELADNLLYNYNIFVTPGIVFGEQGKKFIRVSLSASDNEIDIALKTITEKFNQ